MAGFRFLTVGRRPPPCDAASAHTAPQPACQVEELEPRRLYSATPLLDPIALGVAWEAAPTSSQQLLLPATPAAAAATTAATSDATPASATRQEVVFIDASVPDAQQMLALLQSQADPSRLLQVFWLDPQQDGVAQITDALAQLQDVDAIHLISHGADGSLQLGRSTLDATTLVDHAGQIASWSQALAADADMLIYGCDVAASEAGKQFVADLGLLSGADVAASDDLTGDSARGGDWLLEYQDGQIQTAAALAAWQQAAWHGLLATYTVTNTNDSGAGSLRTAITSANGNAGADTIAFNIGGGGGSYGEHTISLSSALPTITEAVTIDGSTQSGYGAAGHPLIVIDGNDLNASGLTLSSTADGSTIRGLVIRNFGDNGINIQSGSAGNTIVANYIGSFNADGSDAGVTKANGLSGIQVSGANSVIGGTTAADRNVISGNTSRGIRVSTGADGSSITGNYIGLTAAGTAAFTNAAQWGIHVEGSASSITIGGTAAGARNVISGHALDGLWITGSSTVTATGNYIGTNAAGTAAVANAQNGVYFGSSFAGMATIGGSAAGAGNVISGNSQDGINALFTGDVTIQGNIIGLNAAGTSAIGNGDAGIEMALTGTVVIGGSTAAERNVISGNLYGIDLSGSPTSGSYTLQGNYIGVASDGTTLLGNTSHGILVQADNALIGGQNSGEGNTIAGNGGDGIALLSGTGSLFYRNSIYSNTGLGIDLNNDGVSANDANDSDSGANYGNNFPVITSISFDGVNTQINGTLDGYPQVATVYFEFFASTTRDASGYGEGKTYLGYVQTTTNASGHATFSTTVTGAVEGDWISVVANMETGEIGGSEFSAAAQVVAPATLSNLSGDTLAYTEDDAASVINQGSAAAVVSNNGYNGGNLTVSFALGSTSSEDLLAIRNQGTGAGQIGVSGSNVSYAGVTIGSVTGGSSGANLVITFNASASDASVSALLNNITYQNSNAGSPSTTSRTVRFVVTDASAVASSNHDTTVTVAARNDAPVLAGSNNFTGINEDNTSSSGTLVSSLISGQLTDADASASTGIAVTAVDNSNGSWQYTTNGGGNWTAFGTPSAAAARLLTSDASTSIRFVPNADWNGSATLTYRAWDQTSGVAASTADVSTNGGTTAFSSATASPSITVAALNDAPVFVSASNFSAITEDQTSNSGQLVSTLFSSTDADSGAVNGIAIHTQTPSNGTWQYSTNAGSSWSAVGSVSGSSALLLRSSDYLRFIPDAQNADSASLDFYIWDQTTSSTGNKVDVSTRGTSTAYSSSGGNTAITVTAVNDAPANSVPGAQSTGEDTALVFSSGNGNQISIADIDAGSSNMQLTLSVSNGTLSLAGVSGLSFLTGDGSADATMVIVGTVANLNIALNGLSYTPSSHYTGSDTLTILSSDQGNTGTGGTLSDSDTVAITVGSTNDAPVNSVPGAQATNEDSALVFSVGNGNLISVSDPDAGGGTLQVTLGVLQGSLSLSGTSGLSFTSGDGSADSSMVFTGTLANINLALAGLSYTPTSHYYGGDTLSILSSDLGNSGSGGTLTDSDSVAITVNSVNDVPVANNDTVSTDPGTPLDIVVLANDTDADHSLASQTVVIVSNSPGTTAVVNGDGSIHFDPGATVGAQQIVYYLVDPQGGTSANATVTVNVAVNNAPTGANNAATISEDASYVLQTADFGFADADLGQSFAGVRIDSLPAAGTLTLNGLAVSAGNVIAAADIAAGDLVLTPAAHANGTPYTSFDFSVQDDFGGTASASNTFTLNVSAVNDAPVESVPGAQSLNEDSTLVFSSGNGNLIAISDIDAGSGLLQVSLSVSNGQLTLSGTTGLSFTTGDGAADASMVFSGSVANINAALSGMVYAPSGHASGADTLTIQTSDLGNTGSGGALTDSETVAITINAVNDAPLNSVPAAQTVAENGTLVFSSGLGNLISIADVDALGANLQVTLGVSNGLLSLSGTSGLSFTSGDGSADASMVFTGSLTDINAALSGLVYTPTSGYSGADTLSILTSDLGNTGAGGTLTDADSVAITVTAVNNAPTASIAPPSYNATEQTSLTLHGTGLSVADADAGSASVQVSLSVVSGTLSAAAGSTGVTLAGSGSSTLTLTGSVAQINNLLAGNGGASLSYLINSNAPPASDTLTLTIDDQGNTGSGGALTASDTATITLAAVNDAPLASASALNAIAQLSLSLQGQGLAIADPDAGSASVQATLAVVSGTLTVSAGGTGVTVGGSGTNSVTLSGSLSQINQLLAGSGGSASYLYSSGLQASTDTLTLSVSDLGNSGSGGTLTASTSVSINVAALSVVPPVITPPLPEPTPSNPPPSTPEPEAPQPETPGNTSDPDDSDNEPGEQNALLPLPLPTDAWLDPGDASARGGLVGIGQLADAPGGRNYNYTTVSMRYTGVQMRPYDVEAASIQALKVAVTSTASSMSIQTYQTRDAPLAPALTAAVHDMDMNMETGGGVSTNLALSLVVTGEAAAIGMTIWASRISSLLMTLMVSVPTWRTYDPLPVLARRRMDLTTAAGIGAGVATGASPSAFAHEEVFDDGAMPPEHVAKASDFVANVID